MRNVWKGLGVGPWQTSFKNIAPPALGYVRRVIIFFSPGLLRPEHEPELVGVVEIVVLR